MPACRPLRVFALITTLGAGHAGAQGVAPAHVPDIPAQGAHVVMPAETLDSIARDHQLTARQLQYYNLIDNPASLMPGEELALPPPDLRVPWNWQSQLADGLLPGRPGREHTVVRGETLAIIARRYGVTPGELQSYNGLRNPNLIAVGQTLRIPQRGGATPVAGETTAPGPTAGAPPPAPPLPAGEPTDQAEATPPETPPPAEAGSPDEDAERPFHTLADGETLETVGRRYFVTERQLRFYNLLPEPAVPPPGTELKIPPPSLRVPWNWQSELAAGRLGASAERRHTVARGESLALIARRYGLTAAQLQAANSLRNPDRLEVGQSLIVPPGSREPAPRTVAPAAAPRPSQPPPPRPGPADPGAAVATHRVQPGDTLSLIARRYGVTVEQMQYLNTIANPNMISVGDRLLVPDPGLRIPPPPPASKYAYMWPLDDFDPSSEFGARWGKQHRGLDMRAPRDTPIRAAADGTVIFSGRQRNYGNVVIIEHDADTQTLYAHNRDNLVRRGQKVVQGQYIGTVGHTGNAQGYHLHFEFVRRGEALNPREHVETVLR